MVDFFNQTPKSRRNPADQIVESIKGVVNQGRPGDYFDDKQMAQESGGRQKAADGSTLVGRYPDGSLPAPDKRAYGAGQMQVGTAKNTAKQFGIPWDMNRFMNDKDYNLQLANKHMEHLTKKYGDKRLAKAAYHQGEPTVDKALATHGRDGVLAGKGIGPVGRQYMGADGSSSTQAGGGGAIPMKEVKDIRAVGASESERAAMQQGREFEVVDPFKIGESARGSATQIEGRAKTLDETIGSAIDETNRLQAEQAAALEQRNSIRAGAREDVRTGTEEMLKISKPIFQKKQAIAQRLGEIADMSPLERMIKGTFDPNFNVDVLQARDGLYAKQLNALAEEYEYTTGLQTKLIATAAESYADQEDLFQLKAVHQAQDIQLLGQSLASAEGELSRVMTNIGVDSAIERSKQYAITDTVANLTPGQLNEGVTNAVNGFTTINGMPIPVTMIEERLNALQEVEYAMASRDLALQSQNMALVEQAETRAIGFMTQAEIESAIANNGMFKGQQLPVDKLVQQQVTLAQSRQVQVESMAVNEAPQVVSGTLRMIGSRVKSINARAAGLGGGGDPEAVRLNNTITLEMTRINEGIKDATRRGVQNEYMASVLPQLQKLVDMQDKYVEGFVKTWSAGNKDLAAVGNAWMTGQPLNTRAAARGLIVLARDGQPNGMKLQGPALAAFRAAQAEVKALGVVGANTPTFAGLNSDSKTPKDGITEDMISRVMKVASDTYAQDLSDRAIRSLPELAKEVKTGDGKPHPFNRVSPQDYADALSLGDEEGYSRVGQDMGLKSAEAKSLFSQNSDSQAWTKFLQGQDGDKASYDYWAGRLVSMQTQSMLKHLDRTPSASNGFREGFKPSDALASLLADPQLRIMVGRSINDRGQASLGDFLIGQAGGVAAVDSFNAYADSVPSAQRVRRSQALSDSVARSNELLSNPTKRFEYILATIPGLDDQEQARLLAGTKQQLGIGIVNDYIEAANTYIPDFVGAGESRSRQYDSFILNGKFEDPGLEALRKRAAKHWETVAPRAESLISKILGN